MSNNQVINNIDLKTIDIEEVYKKVWIKINNEEYPNLKHLIKDWNEKTPLSTIRKVLDQIYKFNILENNFLNYYIKRAVSKVQASKFLVQPFNEFYEPDYIRKNRVMNLGESFERYEIKGMLSIKDTAFIINAVHTGEEYGFNHSVMLLSINSQSRKSLLQMYCEYILELQIRTSDLNHEKVSIPIYFIVSEATNNDINDSLAYNDLYGLQSTQITILKQKNVPVFKDDKCHALLDENINIIDTFHGDGGIHYTLRDHEIERDPSKPFLKGKKYAVLLSDNNYLQFKVLPHLLGIIDKEEKNVVIPSVIKNENEPIKMFLAREYTNAEFVQRYGTVDWSKILHPVHPYKKYHVGYPFNWDAKGSKDFFSAKVAPDTRAQIEHEVALKKKNDKGVQDENYEQRQQDMSKRAEESIEPMIRERREKLNSDYDNCHRLMDMMVVSTEEYKTTLVREGLDPHEYVSLQLDPATVNLNPQIDNDVELFTYRKNQGGISEEKRNNLDDIYFEKKIEAIKEAYSIKYDQAKPWALRCQFLDIIETYSNNTNFWCQVYPRWLCNNTFENSVEEAVRNVQLKIPPMTLSTSEYEMYYCFYRILYEFKVKLPPVSQFLHNNIPHMDVPIIFISPRLACTMNELKVKLYLNQSDVKLKIGPGSMLQLSGNIQVKNLTLNGAMVLTVGNSGTLSIEKLKLMNKGVKLIPLKGDIAKMNYVDQSDKLKGWKMHEYQIYWMHVDNVKEHIYEDSLLNIQQRSKESDKMAKLRNLKI